MTRNLLKIGLCIKQSFWHNLSKEWMPKRDVVQCGVTVSVHAVKKKNKKVNFGYQIEMGLVDQNNRYNRMQ